MLLPAPPLADEGGLVHIEIPAFPELGKILHAVKYRPGHVHLRALAAGYTLKAEHGFVVVIERVGVFVQDDFNFGYSTDKEDQSYYHWSCKNRDFDYTKMLDGTSVELHNSDFREFRRLHKKGGDFLVLSDVHEVILQDYLTFDVKQS